MKAKFEGVIAAMATPMNADESINFEEEARLVKHLAKEGLHGLAIGGTTGEYSLMSLEERKQLIKTAVDAAAGTGTYIVAGTGCHRETDTLELSKYAGEVGADFVLVLTPYYLPTSEEGILEYYYKIADNTKAGVVIYHYPANTSGVELSPEFIMKLAEHPNIVGIKNTHNMFHTAQLIALNRHSGNFKICNGYELLFLPTLAAGGDAIMGIVPNLAPKALREMYDAVVAGDLIRAAEINDKLVPLYNAQETAEDPCPGPVKYGLDLQGFHMGNPRKPVTPVHEQFKPGYQELMRQCGVL